jgi:hypothetical protein
MPKPKRQLHVLNLILNDPQNTSLLAGIDKIDAPHLINSVPVENTQPPTTIA